MSAALYGMERVLSQAEAALRAGMTAKLTALDSEYADGLTLAVPDAVGENLLASCSEYRGLIAAAGHTTDWTYVAVGGATNPVGIEGGRTYAISAGWSASGMSGSDAAAVKIWWKDSAGATVATTTVRSVTGNGSGTATASATAPFSAVSATCGQSVAADAGQNGFNITTGAWSLTDDGNGYYNEAQEPAAADIAKLTRPAVVLFPMLSAGEMNASRESADQHSFVVGIICQAATKAEMSAKLYRYVRAFREILTASTALTCGQVEWASTDWNARDLTPAKGRYTVAAVVSAFTCTVYEFAE